MTRKVTDVLTSEVIVARPSTAYQELVRLLTEHRIGAVPVVDGARHVLGVVSALGLLLREERPADAFQRFRLASKRHRLERPKAAGGAAVEVMTAPAITIRSDGGAAEAARLLRRNLIKQLLATRRAGWSGSSAGRTSSRSSCAPTRRSAGRSWTNCSGGARLLVPGASRSASATGWWCWRAPVSGAATSRSWSGQSPASRGWYGSRTGSAVTWTTCRRCPPRSAGRCCDRQWQGLVVTTTAGRSSDAQAPDRCAGGGP